MEKPRSPDLAARLFGARPEATLALLRATWPTAVGEELARRSEVVAIDGGVLRVKVPDLRWQRTLLRMRGFILARLARVAGQAAPRRLGFVTGEVADRVPAPAPDRAATPAPPPPATVAEAARAIPDPEIRAAFLAAAGAYLARFGQAQAGGSPEEPSEGEGGATASSAEGTSGDPPSCSG